jgi:hypothetical protein
VSNAETHLFMDRVDTSGPLFRSGRDSVCRGRDVS